MRLGNSNLGPISHRFWDTATYRLKTHVFLSLLINPEFENVPLALDRWNFAGEELWDWANYSFNKISDSPTWAMRSLQRHTGQTDIQTAILLHARNGKNVQFLLSDLLLRCFFYLAVRRRAAAAAAADDDDDLRCYSMWIDQCTPSADYTPTHTLCSVQYCLVAD